MQEPQWHTFLFELQVAVAMRVVCPEDVKKVLLKHSRLVYWKGVSSLLQRARRSTGCTSVRHNERSGTKSQRRTGNSREASHRILSAEPFGGRATRQSEGGNLKGTEAGACLFKFFVTMPPSLALGLESRVECVCAVSGAA